MAIEIVSFPNKHGGFPVRYVNVYQRVTSLKPNFQFWDHQSCGELTFQQHQRVC